MEQLHVLRDLEKLYKQSIKKSVYSKELTTEKPSSPLRRSSSSVVEDKIDSPSFVSNGSSSSSTKTPTTNGHHYNTNTNNNNPSINLLQESIKKCSYTLLNPSDLYNDYAQEYGLYERCLMIMNICNSEEDDVVELLWQEVLDSILFQDNYPEVVKKILDIEEDQENISSSRQQALAQVCILHVFINIILYFIIYICLLILYIYILIN